MAKLLDLTKKAPEKRNLSQLNIREISRKDIAIIGISCKFPDANNPKEFWSNLQHGKCSIKEFPENRRQDTDHFVALSGADPTEVVYADGGYLDRIDQFDPKFFGISPKEASLMDPHQRLFLEIAWKTLEDAGYGGERIIGDRTGIYVGYSSDFGISYKRLVAEFVPSDLALAVPGNLQSIIASRIAYLLDFKGPSMMVDTACSSSLTAVHLACRALRQGECELALAGGVRVKLIPLKGSNAGIGISSADYRTRTFDDSSDGTGFGEGAAAILLKPLEDALADHDHIYAVIKGSAVNQDGSSAGITAPNALAQADVIERAWTDARIDPKTITYIEAHGTGTRLGDPIEIDGISRAFRKYTQDRQFCGIGSVKSNLGHLDNAAGIAGLIKVILSLNHKMLVPTVNFQNPNRKINFTDSPVYVVDHPQIWEVIEAPRRCGISAFGLSGTNCHLVLEEAPDPELPKRDGDSQEKHHLLALSTKSEETLQLLIQEYQELLQKNPELNLGDLCYTANTGRWHHTNRVLIVFKDLQELQNRLTQLTLDQKNQFNAEGIFCGEYRIIAKNQSNRQPGEITDQMKKELTAEANLILLELLKDRNNHKLITTLGQLYVSGAEIEWQKLYADDHYQKLSLPTFIFDLMRCWIQPEKFESPTTTIEVKELKHPLLDRCLAESIDRDTFVTEFTVTRMWELAEHKVSGNYVLPGTTYLEMVREAVKNILPTGFFEYRDVVFISPLVLTQEELREVQTIIKKEDEHLAFVISSKLPNSGTGALNWLKHAEGKLYPVEKQEVRYDLDGLFARCPEEIPYNNQRSGRVIELGPRWQNVRKIYLGEEQLLVRLELLEEYQSDQLNYGLHPALLDMAVNVASQSAGQGLFLPLSYGSFKLYDQMPTTVYSYLRWNGKDKNKEKLETITFNIDLLDSQGNLFAEIRDYTIKKVHQKALKFGELARSGNYYHQIGWIEEEFSGAEGELSPGAVLIFRDEDSRAEQLIAELATLHKDVIEVQYGSEYQKIDQYHYQITGLEDDYDRLVADIEMPLGYLLHLATIGLSSDTLIEEQLNRGVYSLFHLVRALNKSKYHHQLRILLVTDQLHLVTGRESAINPVPATLVGFGKVVGQEMESFKCRVLDLDSATDTTIILQELQRPDQPYIVAYRSNQRYVEEFRRVNLAKLPVEPIQIRQDGVYLLTGGLGGIGLEIGKYLASLHKHGERVTLALLNRTPLPDRSSWDLITDENIVKKIQAIYEMEREGAEVVFYSGDVTNPDDLKVVFSDLRKQYGQINGIIHSAGVAGDGLIVLKSLERFNEVLRPKVIGTYLLHMMTLEDELDFFINFSSINSLFGGIGQSDYTSANAYLDAFAYARHLTGRRTLSINWPAWRETGMAVDYGVNMESGIFKGITTERALSVFDQLLTKDVTRIVIGELNYGNPIFVDHEHFPIKLDLETRTDLARWQRHTSGKTMTKLPKTLKNVTLYGRDVDEYSEMERKLGQIWGEVLGIEEVNVFEDFYELGGDSILAIKISNTIKEHLGVRIEISDLFEYLTITELSEYLSGRLLTEGIQNMESSHKALDNDNNIPVVEDLVQSAALSNAQHRMWFLQKFEPEMTAYNLITTLPIEQEVDADVLDQALQVVIQRHSVLRTVFKEHEGLPTQVVLPELDLRIQRIDLSDKEDQNQILKTMVLADKEIPFDLSQPLLRVKLFKLNSQKYYLYYNIHHIITDGWSLKIFHQELLRIYEANLNGRSVQLEPLQTSYLQWVREQERWSQTQEFAQLEKYWLEELAKPLPVLNLPTDYPRPQKQTYNGSYLSFKLDREQTLRLKELARKTNATLFMTMLSIYVLLLNKLSGDQDIIVGSPITGRDDKQLERIMGLFINTITIRVNFTDLESVTDLIHHVKAKSLQAYRHSRYPFDRLVTRLNPERDFSRSPIFSTMFQFYEEIPPANEGISLFDLSFLSREVQGEIEVRLEYNTDLLNRESIQRIVTYYMNILQQIDQQVEKISKIHLLTDEQKRDILRKFSNIPESEYVQSTIIEGFNKQVLKHPDDIAVICEKKGLTYAELDTQSTQLARLLIKEGVQFNEPVGIMLGRGIEMIVGMLGILKAGGAYVPLDPDYPIERLSYMLNHSEARFIITETGLLSQVQELVAKENHLQIWIDLTGEELNPLAGIRGYSLNDLQKESTAPVIINYHPDHLMYIIYTSGSTGKPKGVMVTQRNALNFLNWSITDGRISHSDQMLLVTSMSFDISVFEIFGALLSGAKLNILTKERLQNPDSIIDYLINQKVTIWHSVPTMMAQILLALKIRRKTQDIQLHLRRVMIGGEAWSGELAREIREHLGDVEILNMYGPTEATIWVTSYSIGSDLSTTAILPIGKPLPNNRIVILDTDLNLCGINIPGDIYITGENVTKGYYKDKLKTKDAFISFELEEGQGPEVLYRTGDVGRYLADGNIEYLSRKDGMVKVRGYRIEVGEIENTLIAREEIKEVAVIAKPEGETHRLVCYYTTIGMSDSQSLKDYLTQKIPTYMIPAQFIELKEMPLTPNGKIDRKQLLTLEISSHFDVENEYVAPADEVQEFLANVWQELLGINQIGINDKFFNIGGNSFLVSQMHAKIETKYPGIVNVADIFTYPTIASLAEYILNTADVTEVSTDVTAHNTDEELLKLISDMDSGELSVEDVLKNIEMLEVEDE